MINTNMILGWLTIFVGSFLFVKLRFFILFHPVRCLKNLLRSIKKRENRRLLTLALAGTLGVGNIYGVALGIMIGGEGSVFWLFISSFFALVIKYSESVTAAAYSKNGTFGMISVFEDSFGSLSRPISLLYALFAIGLSLFMGSFIQADSFIGSLTYIIPIPRIFAAVILFVLTALVIFGGKEKIKSTTELLIPPATLIYVFITLFVIMRNISELPAAFERMIASAFSGKSIICGIIPTFTSLSFSEGFVRGILSNESGIGTSAMAHTENKKTPAEAGLFGMCEIFFDTMLLCMLTAFTILASVEDVSVYNSAMTLIFDAVKFGGSPFFVYPLFICIFLFAYSTVICWYYYGTGYLSFLSPKRGVSLYLFTFLLFIILASVFSTGFAIVFNDLLLFLMSVPTHFALIKNSNKVMELTRDYGLLPRRKKNTFPQKAEKVSKM